MANRKDYEGDIAYGIWRSGGNPDHLNPDRVDDAYGRGIDADLIVRDEVRRQRQVSERRRELEQEMAEVEGWDWYRSED